MSFFKFDIYWYPIYFIQYMYRVFIDLGLALMRTYFAAYDLQLLYLVLFENQFNIEQLNKLPDILVKLFIRDVAQTSTIPWLRELEEIYIKRNKVVAIKYNEFKNKVKAILNWPGPEKYHAWLEKHFISHIRSNLNFDYKKIFKIIYWNRRLHSEWHDSVDKFYKRRTSIIKSMNTRFHKLNLEYASSFQQYKLSFHLKNKNIDEFAKQTTLPYYEELMEIYNVKKYWRYGNLHRYSTNSSYILDLILSNFCLTIRMQQKL